MEMQSTWMKGTDIALRCVDLSVLQHYSTIMTVGWTFNLVFVQVNPELKSHFEEKGFRFVGQDVEGERMEVIELDGMSGFFQSRGGKMKNLYLLACNSKMSRRRPSLFCGSAVPP